MKKKPYMGFGPLSKFTPQNQAIPGREAAMAPNLGGGVSFVLGDMQRFRTWLILGSPGNTYYAKARTLTKENLDVLDRLIKAGQGMEALEAVIEISESGRASKNDPALFALARLCACDQHGKVTKNIGKDYSRKWTRQSHPDMQIEDGQTIFWHGYKITRDGETLHATKPRAAKTIQVEHPKDIEVRRAAYAALPRVARIGTHLFHFMSYVEQFRGKGSLHRNAVKAWYQEKAAKTLSYQLVKYQNRDGWSQCDVLRLARPTPVDALHNNLYEWSVKGWSDEEIEVLPAESDLALVWAYEQAKKTKTVSELVELIDNYKLTHEMIPTHFKTNVQVWHALLLHMPMEAMMRNLANMTRYGVFPPYSAALDLVVERFRNAAYVKASKLHPLKILTALKTYASGRSPQNENRKKHLPASEEITWIPVQKLVDALNDAFYLSFKSVEPTGKRIMVGLDVSGSMNGGTLAGIQGMTPRVAGGTLALLFAATEPNVELMAFSDGFMPLNISPRQRLDDVVRYTDSLPFSWTDCSLPMTYAIKHKIQVDAFVIITDSETNAANSMQPMGALREYRMAFNSNAKLIVVAMTSEGFSIADPLDGGCLDVVGFDTNIGELVTNFIADKF